MGGEGVEEGGADEREWLNETVHKFVRDEEALLETDAYIRQVCVCVCACACADYP